MVLNKNVMGFMTLREETGLLSKASYILERTNNYNPNDQG